VSSLLRQWRSTIRVRLTLLYAGAFLVAAAVLVALIYLYLGQVLDHQRSTDDLQHVSPGLHDALTAQLQRARDVTLSAMLVGSLILLAVVGVFATALGWLLAGRVLRPLQQITATARRVADRNLHERIALAGPDDEIKDLADTFDSMLVRLDRSFDNQRQFVANASHELRTPLTINRTLIEVALGKPGADESLRELGATLLAVNERHERLIDGLLTLASGEQPLTEPVGLDLADVARHVVAESRSAASQSKVDLRTQLGPGPIVGDPILLERLAHNLVDNAIRYNLPERGWVKVTTEVVDGEASLIVENSGLPVPADEVQELFEPFRRSAATERVADAPNAPSGRGAGLGLSIVRSVARAHGGDVDAWAREEGGLVVRVRIPGSLDPRRSDA
jgi:signal transduction histidine kinase